jgi:UDP-N-acetylglucosamine/UDP-N-acetylgalactosamine diphosphorylase
MWMPYNFDPQAIDRELPAHPRGRVQPRANQNLEYLGQLFALREWYRKVRLPTTPEPRRPVMEAALDNIAACIQERMRQLDRFLRERGAGMPAVALSDSPPCPLQLGGVHPDHVAWVQGLDEAQVAAGIAWLQQVVRRVVEPAVAQLADQQQTAPAD